jgi:hypothetical protein
MGKTKCPPASYLACRRINAPAEPGRKYPGVPLVRPTVSAQLCCVHCGPLCVTHRGTLTRQCALCAPPKLPQKAEIKPTLLPSARALAGHLSCSL